MKKYIFPKENRVIEAETLEKAINLLNKKNVNISKSFSKKENRKKWS